MEYDILIDVEEINKKLEMLKALAIEAYAKHIYFWRISKSKVACALGSWAISSRSIDEKNYHCDNALLSFTPRSRRALEKTQLPLKIGLSELDYFPHYQDLVCSFIDKVQEALNNGLDIIGEHVDAFETRKLKKGEEWVQECHLLSAKEYPTLEKLVVEHDLNGKHK